MAHNLIHDITHSGVYGRHWATATQPKERRNQEQGLAIEFNEIFNVMLNINDGAGVFIRDSNITINNNSLGTYVGSPRPMQFGIVIVDSTSTNATYNKISDRTVGVMILSSSPSLRSVDSPKWIREQRHPGA